jgi:hypothetical protein
MPITAIFSKQRPNIGGLYFDALLEESDELQTDVTRYPIESGVEGNDHAVNRNQRFTMLVAVSDNPARALAAQASQSSVFDSLTNIGLPEGALQTIIGGAASVGVGAIARRLPGNIAALAGLGASIANAGYAAGQATTRSSSVLEEIRRIQRTKEIIVLSTSKGTYNNCIITNTRRTTTTQNENGLELAVELEQLRIMNSQTVQIGLPAINDTASVQATPYGDYGLIQATPL